jgi:hypothetical protein
MNGVSFCHHSFIAGEGRVSFPGELRDLQDMIDGECKGMYFGI